MEGEWKRSAAEIFKAAGVALIFCMAAVLLFAFVVKTASLSSEVIAPVNRVIKASAIFLGCMLAIQDRGGWEKGGAAGVLSVVATKLLFSLIALEFSLDLLFLAELLFGFLVGVISGAIAVNIHK